MKEPERTKFFIQILRTRPGKTRRGFMAIPAKAREILEKRGWKNKDTCWVIVGEHGDWFSVFHTYEAYSNFMKFVGMAEKNKKLAVCLKKGIKQTKRLEER